VTEYRKIICRPPRAVPHIVKWYGGQWKCYSHNASALGDSPSKALMYWSWQQKRFERIQRNRRDFYMERHYGERDE
jgi:hypothetical protein